MRLQAHLCNRTARGKKECTRGEGNTNPVAPVHVAGARQARTDCPLHMPDAPKALGHKHATAEARLPLNDLQHQIVKAFATLAGRNTSTATLPKLQGEASEWVARIARQHLSKAPAPADSLAEA